MSLKKKDEDGSVQLKTVSKSWKKPICAPRAWLFFTLALPFKQFKCLSD